MIGHGIPYQDYDETLAEQLRSMIQLESSPDFLVCLSDVFKCFFQKLTASGL